MLRLFGRRKAEPTPIAPAQPRVVHVSADTSTIRDAATYRAANLKAQAMGAHDLQHALALWEDADAVVKNLRPEVIRLHQRVSVLQGVADTAEAALERALIEARGAQSLRQELDFARANLLQAARQFEGYAVMHEAKNTADGRQKAATNRTCATLCRRAAEGKQDAAWDGALRPGHTDLMVDPENLDAFMEANPLPADTTEPRCKHCGAQVDERWTTCMGLNEHDFSDPAHADDYVAREPLTEVRDD